MQSDEKSVLIFGSGRSGTTWVQDALAEANEYGTVFEPLHPRCVRGAEEFANLYIPRESRNERLSEFLQPWLSGAKHSVWTSERVHPDLLFPRFADLNSVRSIRDTRKIYAKLVRRWWRNRSRRGRPLVIKLIRGNLMAEWMSDTFGLASALVVRHPCAVLSSVARRHGKDWEPAALRNLLNRYVQQPLLANKILDSGRIPVQKYRSLASVQTAIWCIENARQLSSAGNSGVHVVYYEQLLAEPVSTWSMLTDALGLRETPGKDLLLRPSQQASIGTGAEVNSDKQLTDWQTQLGGEELEEVSCVLSAFGVDTYSVDSPMPQTRAEPVVTP
ncbi:MAG TPA: sulfotransferase [Woeseiaceae bacterium]|nr:sulfotransferase [Woeseiaceae bacterium]